MLSRTYWLRILTTLLVLVTVGLMTGLVQATAIQLGEKIANVKMSRLRRSTDFLYGQEAIIQSSIDYATEESEFNDLVFVGDSTCLHDCNTPSFMQQTGLKAYNLGTVGSIGLEGAETILKFYLRNHPKPGVVVLTMTPESFGCAPGHYDERGQMYDDFKAAYVDPDSEVKTDVLPLSSFSTRDFMRFGFRALIPSGNDDINNPHLVGRKDLLWRDWSQKRRESRGFLLMGPRVGNPARWAWQGNPPFKLLPERIDAFNSMIQTTGDLGIRLVVALGPLASIEPLRDFTSLTPLLEAAEKANPHVRVLRPINYWYDSSLSTDRYHLNGKGGERFTHELAQFIMSLSAPDPMAR